MLFPRKIPRTFARPVDERRYNKPGSPWFKDQDGRFFCAYEIEAVLEGVNGVSEAAVVRRKGHIRAYYTTVSGKSWPGIKERLWAAVRAELAGREHMWPQSYAKLAELPRIHGAKKLDRKGLATSTRLRKSGAGVPEVVGAVNEWRFEGVIEAVPARSMVVIAHRTGGPQAKAIRLTISRDNLPIKKRLCVGRWGVFEGYFKGEMGMMMTNFTLLRSPVRQVSLDKVDAVFDAL